MTNKITEITAAEDFTATLIASGYSADDAKAMTAFLGDQAAITVESLAASRKMEMAETLSLYWLINELRKRVTAPHVDDGAAVEALKMLVHLSEKYWWLIKP